MHSVIVVSVEMLKGSSSYLYAVLNSDSFDQVASQILGSDFVDEVNEFRKAKASRCTSRKPGLDFLVQEMREGRVSQEPKGKRAAHNIGVETSRLSVMPSGTWTAATLLDPAEADWRVVQSFRASQF